MSRYVRLNLYEGKSYGPNCWTVSLPKYPQTAAHLELGLQCSPKRPELSGREKGTLFSNGDLRRSIHLPTRNTDRMLVGWVGTSKGRSLRQCCFPPYQCATAAGHAGTRV